MNGKWLENPENRRISRKVVKIKIKNKDQEPALRAQGFYVHKVHKQAEIATNK